MQTTKKKPCWPLIAAGAILSVFLGYLFGGAYKSGMGLMEFLDAWNVVWKRPFANYLSSMTPKAVAMALMVYAIAVLMYYTSQRNYMPGREFGTAKFADVKQVNSVIADRDPF
ncbi:MAG: hypothetical protein IIU47_09065, partial [Lachnospiraceae bacterium]|nr:hypothetical protein [Lachnospiraceae bacterium]